MVRHPRDMPLVYRSMALAGNCMVFGSFSACSEPLWYDPVRSHIPPQRFRHNYAAVRLLIIFENRQPRPAHSQTASVQRVHVFAALAALWTIANIGPPRLVGFKIRA